MPERGGWEWCSLHQNTPRVILTHPQNIVNWTTSTVSRSCSSGRFSQGTQQRVSEYARKFTLGSCTFFGVGDESKWYGILNHKPNGEWNCAAELMMLKFAEGGHSVFRGTSSLSRGTLKSKGGGKTSRHYNAEPHTAELLLRTIISVNKLCVSTEQWRISATVKLTPQPNLTLKKKLHQKFHQRLYQLIQHTILWTPGLEKPGTEM